MMVPPGFSRPSRSASSIILRAMRSLIELPGLKVSTLASTSAAMIPLGMRCRRTSGVCPMVSRMVLQIRGDDIVVQGNSTEIVAVK